MLGPQYGAANLERELLAEGSSEIPGELLGRLLKARPGQKIVVNRQRYTVDKSHPKSGDRVDLELKGGRGVGYVLMIARSGEGGTVRLMNLGGQGQARASQIGPSDIRLESAPLSEAVKLKQSFKDPPRGKHPLHRAVAGWQKPGARVSTSMGPGKVDRMVTVTKGAKKRLGVVVKLDSGKKATLPAQQVKSLKEAQRVTPTMALPHEEKPTKPGSFKVSSTALNMFKRETKFALPSDHLFKNIRDYLNNVPREELPKFFGIRTTGAAAIPETQDYIANKPRPAFYKWLRLTAKTDPKVAKYVRAVPENAALVYFMFLTRISGVEMAKIIFRRYFETDSGHSGELLPKGKKKSKDKAAAAAKHRAMAARIVGTADLSGMAEMAPATTELRGKKVLANAKTGKPKPYLGKGQADKALAKLGGKGEVVRFTSGGSYYVAMTEAHSFLTSPKENDMIDLLSEKGMPAELLAKFKAKKNGGDSDDDDNGGNGGGKKGKLPDALKKHQFKKKGDKAEEGLDLDERSYSMGQMSGGAARQMLLQQLRKKKADEDKKKKKQGGSYGHGKMAKQEELEAELERLETTTSPFPEVREARIELVRAELEKLQG